MQLPQLLPPRLVMSLHGKEKLLKSIGIALRKHSDGMTEKTLSIFLLMTEVTQHFLFTKELKLSKFSRKLEDFPIPTQLQTKSSRLFSH